MTIDPYDDLTAEQHDALGHTIEEAVSAVIQLAWGELDAYVAAFPNWTDSQRRVFASETLAILGEDILRWDPYQNLAPTAPTTEEITA